MELFHKLWRALEQIAVQAGKHRTKIAFEWPTGCELWKLEQVRRFMSTYQLAKTNIHGCAVGLKSKVDGKPIYKPWTIATNSATINTFFQDCRCPGKANHPEHRPCAGVDTKSTENYTPQMVRIIHKAWEQDIQLRKPNSKKDKHANALSLIHI